MMDLLSVLDGWKYTFPYFRENVPFTSSNYTTLYKTEKDTKRGGIIFAALVTDTANFRLKINTGNTDLHEIDVKGLLYGQAPSGFNVPSGLVANIYIPIQETENVYPIPIFDPQVSPATTLILESSTPFPFRDGLELQLKPDKPPMTVLAFALGLVSIEDKDKFIASLNKVYAGGK